MNMGKLAVLIADQGFDTGIATTSEQGLRYSTGYIARG